MLDLLERRGVQTTNSRWPNEIFYRSYQIDKAGWQRSHHRVQQRRHRDGQENTRLARPYDRKVHADQLALALLGKLNINSKNK